MQSTQDSTLSELVERLSTVKGVIGIVLFRSRAKGDADEYSDYDLLVLFRD